MGFFRNIRRSYYEWRYDRLDTKRVKAATIPPPDYLFNSSGWGPAKPANRLDSKPYQGPLYPEPAYKFNPRKMAPAFSEDATKLCNKARQAWSKKQFEAAKQAYEQAIAAAPNNPDFLFEESQMLWSQGELEKAHRLLNRAIEIDPCFAAAYASRIRLSLKQGMKSHLRDDFAKLDRDAFDLGILHAVGDEVRPALGIANN